MKEYCGAGTLVKYHRTNKRVSCPAMQGLRVAQGSNVLQKSNDPGPNFAGHKYLLDA